MLFFGAVNIFPPLLKSPMHVEDHLQRLEKKVGDRIVLHTASFVLGGRDDAKVQLQVIEEYMNGT